jgi:hypothetical protein
MRLDFNMVVVDDDFLDEDDRHGVDELIKKLKHKVASKGFELKEQCFPSIEAATAGIQSQNRVDLFLSDNNLGNNPEHEDPNLSNGGIEYYLKLKEQEYICDFLLYTRTDKNEIVRKLSDDLNKSKNPNLFSRFTFVNRDETDSWHAEIISLFDHLLTKREELNNLRGLYAQKVSEIDLRLKNNFHRNERDSFKKAINKVPKIHINKQNKKMLHEVREIRNGLMHCEECFCETRNQFVIRFTGDNRATIYEIYENDLQKYRNILNKAYEFVMTLSSN